MKNATSTFERRGCFIDNVLRVAIKSRLKQHTDTEHVVNNRTININDLCVDVPGIQKIVKTNMPKHKCFLRKSNKYKLNEIRTMF